jgi:phosphate acetyltransferase
MKILEKLYTQAQTELKHIVLPEGQDDRTLQAAHMIVQRGLARITVLGRPDNLQLRAQKLGVSLDGVQLVDHLSHADFARYAKAFHTLRRHKGVTEEEAAQAVRDPLYYANMMVREGQAQGTVAGATNTTAHTVRSALLCLGLAKGIRTVSSFFLMSLAEHPGIPRYGASGTLLFADCGVVIDPNAEQLAEIAICTADTCRNLVGAEPKVAMLSFSTKGSAEHALVEKVRKATENVRARRPDIAVDGELQVDAALVPSVGEKKSPGSAVAGQANVLIFPDLQSGNIGYKLVERLAGASAVGPILQGLELPSNDLSRGCKAEDILDAVVITSIQAAAVRT